VRNIGFRAGIRLYAPVCFLYQKADFEAMSSPAVIELRAAVPLCVDLDGTLIKTDLLWESFVRLLRRNPLFLFVVPLWLFKGRANLKHQIATRADLDAASLPYHQIFLDFLRAEKQQGRTLILVTACDYRLAKGVAEHLGLFAEVMASDGQLNLRGTHKAAKLAERFGERGFDYAGNSSTDLPVWQQAREAIVVNAHPNLATRAGNCARVSRVFESSGSCLRPLLRVLRPHQWVKNLILFVPLLTSHKLEQFPLLFDGILAFIAFSLCASAVYVLNDLLDLDADRHHPTKKFRPFASGDLPLPIGLLLFPILMAVSAGISRALPPSFAGVLAVYLVLTTSYSWRLKRVALLDVFFLAGLYTIRLVAGHEATGVVYSFWLLAFSMFIFLSLALVKRCVELSGVRQQKGSHVRGRGYGPEDLELVATLGTVSGYLAVLVLALYVNSPEVRVLYRYPTALLLVCPLLLYWISRVWLLAHRGQMHDDPIVFALKDRVSYIVGALTLAVLWLGTGH
jgi:4-hydroxybenzoate polyprenyltransferase/phosphoserine phosphatase